MDRKILTIMIKKMIKKICLISSLFGFCSVIASSGSYVQMAHVISPVTWAKSDALFSQATYVQQESEQSWKIYYRGREIGERFDNLHDATNRLDYYMDNSNKLPEDLQRFLQQYPRLQYHSSNDFVG